MSNRRYLSVVVSLACLALPLLATAQPPPITVPSFAELKRGAADSVDITIGPLLLSMAGWFMDDHDQDSARMKKTLQGLKSVTVRSFHFKDAFVYPQADLDALRKQLAQPGWTQMVRTRNESKEDVDIFVALDERHVQGVTVIACGQRELTIVNVVGSIDIDQVQGLRGMFANPAGPVAQVNQQAP